VSGGVAPCFWPSQRDRPGQPAPAGTVSQPPPRREGWSTHTEREVIELGEGERNPGKLLRHTHPASCADSSTAPRPPATAPQPDPGPRSAPALPAARPPRAARRRRPLTALAMTGARG
jgi:hypothetical protein